MPSLNLHRVESITKRIKILDSNTYVLDIVVKNDNGSFDIELFSNDSDNLIIKERIIKPKQNKVLP